jgi:polysaccharide export outer membrane protein
VNLSCPPVPGPARARLGATASVALFAAAAAGCLRPRGEAALAASLDASAAQVAERAMAVDVAVGDRVRVKAWREPQYSDDGLSVDASGEIVLPRVGPLRVTGLTIGTLQDSVRARYAAYLRDPVVTVTVLRRVGLQGEVRAPGLYYVDPTTTLRDVIAQGGGLTEAANASRVEIVREGRLVPVAGAARDRASLAELRSGDAIIVGRRSWLSRNALAVVSTLGLVVSVGVQVFRR